MYFLDRAREREKEILELESADSQFELFNDFPEKKYFSGKFRSFG